MSNAPKVTIEQVEAAIVGETYTVLPDGRTTICQLTLDNGFTVDGHSACVSKENFNAELGNKYSREEAVKKVWGYLGFRLSDQILADSQKPKTFGERLLVESTELAEKIKALSTFLSKHNPHIAPVQLQLLARQLKIMTDYADILVARMEHLRLTESMSRAD